MKLIVFFNAHKISGILTKIFTGCYAYHVGWLDEEHDKIYDMFLLRRRRIWSEVRSQGGTILLFSSPEFDLVTRDYLEKKLESDENIYGWIDYLCFAIRPFYHLFGCSTRNANGVICSEMVNDDIWECGGTTPWDPKDEPPSPCNIYNWIKDR